MNRTIVGFLEAVYVLYMFNWFKTTINFAPAISYIADPIFNHPIDTLDEPRNLVCKFGKDISWLLAAYLILHGFVIDMYPEFYPGLRKLHIGILCFSVVLSLINFNVTMYLLPIVFIEALFLYKSSLE